MQTAFRTKRIDRRTVLISAATITAGLRSEAAAMAETDAFVVSNHGADTVGFVDLATSTMEDVGVGAAPWGIAVSSSRRAYVATAEGVAAVDLRTRTRAWIAEYANWSGDPSSGEYRPGGMGIAVAPDGSRVYTGVYLPDGSSLIEVLDIERREVIASIPCGARPFQLLATRDGSAMYSIDHDSYTVTVLETESLTTRTLPASPLGDANGMAGFEKPHYAALDAAGHLLMPFQGQALLSLNPRTGDAKVRALTADTHQHGIALSPDGSIAAIVGTGPAGGASSAPSLALVDLTNGDENIIPLARPHETCAWSSKGAEVVLTGGYTFGAGGWDGLTVVDVATGSAREIPQDSLPLDIARLL